jgi:hypothetical protein
MHVLARNWLKGMITEQWVVFRIRSSFFSSVDNKHKLRELSSAWSATGALKMPMADCFAANNCYLCPRLFCYLCPRLLRRQPIGATARPRVVGQRASPTVVASAILRIATNLRIAQATCRFGNPRSSMANPCPPCA